MSDYRMISMDTETTGFAHAKGDRIIEVGCVEIINRQLTGKTFTFRCSPGLKPISESATGVHGITDADVRNLRPFSYYIKELFEFIDGADVLFFNGSFDEGNLGLKGLYQALQQPHGFGGAFFEQARAPFVLDDGRTLDGRPECQQ